MLKSLISFGLLAIFFIPLSNANEKVKPASTLLQAFRTQCPSVVTRYVQGSLANIEGLMYTIQTLKEDSNCSGANELESVLMNYNRIYQEYQVYRYTRDDQVDAENRISRFTQLLDEGGHTPDIEYFLQNEIYLAQTDLISVDTRLSRFDNFGNNRALAASQLLTGVEGFLGTWQDNPACFEKKSSMVGSMLSNGLLAAAAFTNPGTSLALAAGGVMVHTLNRFIHEFKYNDAIGDLDGAEMPTAVRCVSQALTDQYCEAQDSINLIDVYRDSFGQDDSRLQGVELLSKHMNHLGHWLQEVYAGSAITSEGDLVNREKPILQAELLEKVLRYIQTYGTIRSRLFSDITSPRERSEAVSIGIANLVSIMSSPTLTPTSGGGPWSRTGGDSNATENPIFISRDKTLLPYQLFDPNMTDVPLCSSGGGVERKCNSLQEYTRVKGVILTLTHWSEALSNALTVVQEVLDQVNIERARTVSVDSFSVLVRANSDLRGETNAISALVKISDNSERIAQYLTTEGCTDTEGNLVLDHCYWDNGKLKPEITHKYSPQITNTRKTADLNKVVLEMVKEGFRPRSLPGDSLPEDCQTASDDRFSTISTDPIEVKSFQITSCITRILKLAERGNDVFFRKIKDMVGYELEARFLSGEFEDEVGDMVYATRVDLINALMDTYSQGTGGVSLGEIYTGLETSMNLTKQCFSGFMKFFDKGVHQYFDQPLAGGEKADLCFRILPYLKNDDQKLMKKAWNTCSKVKMNFYKKGPSLVWTDFIGQKVRTTIFGNKKEKFFVKAEKSEVERFCALKKYNRKNLLIEEYRRRTKELEEKFGLVK